MNNTLSVLDFVRRFQVAWIIAALSTRVRATELTGGHCIVARKERRDGGTVCGAVGGNSYSRSQPRARGPIVHAAAGRPRSRCGEGRAPGRGGRDALVGTAFPERRRW